MMFRDIHKTESEMIQIETALLKPAMDWEEFISTIKYKPGTTFEWTGDSLAPGGKLHITMVVPDRDNPSVKTVIKRSCGLPRWYSEEEAQTFIRFTIRDLELHELDEMLLFNGVRVFDPHRGET